jgi:hypothetical protein
MTAQNTATKLAARYALKAAEAAELAIACFQASAEMPAMATNDEHRNARFAFYLEGTHALRDAREARNNATGISHFPKATATTISYARAAQLVVEDATEVFEELQRQNKEESRVWRREQRLRNEDGSFALTPLEKEEAAARGY